MTPYKKTKQGLLPVETWIPVPSRKLARRHQRLAERLKPEQRKPSGKPSRWLEKQIKAREKKEQEEYDGAMQWVKYYDDRGMEESCRTDPLMTFRALGPPPQTQSGSLPPIHGSNGELLTLSDLDVKAFSEDEEEEDVDLDAFGEEEGEDGTTGGDAEEEEEGTSGEEEAEEDVPLARLICDGPKKVHSKEGRLGFFETLADRADELPPPAGRLSLSQRRAKRKAAIDALVKKRARQTGSPPI